MPNSSAMLTASEILLFVVILILPQVGCTSFSLAPADPIADRLTLTATDGPIPDQAYRAQLSLAYEAPGKILTGRRTTIHVLVKNISQVIWPYAGQPDGRYQIKVGNRWLDQQGKTIEDGRGALPFDLQPGRVAEVLLVVTAPVVRGNYMLEFDLVQEQVAWFRDKGGESLRINLLVE